MAEQHARSRWGKAFEVSSTLVMVGLASVMVWQRSGVAVAEPPTLPSALAPTEPVSIANSARAGSATAQVAIIEYSDFECPACAQFASEIKPGLFRDYVDNGLAIFVYKHFPLPTHNLAPAAAAAAWCAGRQGKFWQMHDRLFASPQFLAEPEMRTAALDAGLDLEVYRSCYRGTEAAEHVQLDRTEAIEFGIPATPTFYFGKLGLDGRVQVSHVLTGSRSIEAFKAILETLLE